MEERIRRLISSTEYRQALALPDDITETYELLAQGEYNINYLFTHPVSSKRLVLRINCGSQMHLEDQIGYEAEALKMLEPSGRTPKVYYVDGSRKYLDNGILVMDWLPGRALDYRGNTDLDIAAGILADIHAVKVPERMIPKVCDEYETGSMIAPGDSLNAILKECEEMNSSYLESELAHGPTADSIRKLLNTAWRIAGEKSAEDTCGYRCCINTELNSTNFLINGPDSRNYLIDWEKPLYGDPAQDLGHFLAPTTTFWKTDVILDHEKMDRFIDKYIEAVSGRFDTEGIRERTMDFVLITCLRGITWCAMAWAEYQDPSRPITNESTRKKLDQYLEPGFLEYIGELLEQGA